MKCNTLSFSDWEMFLSSPGRINWLILKFYEHFFSVDLVLGYYVFWLGASSPLPISFFSMQSFMVSFVLPLLSASSSFWNSLGPHLSEYSWIWVNIMKSLIMLLKWFASNFVMKSIEQRISSDFILYPQFFITWKLLHFLSHFQVIWCHSIRILTEPLKDKLFD